MIKEKVKNIRVGFTLAEVLITLAIIGVVAAMTIPALIKDYQKAQTETALKKAYTQFNQALMQLTSDTGCNGNLACTGLLSTPNTTFQAFGDEITKYLKLEKNCQMNVGQGCFAKIVNANFDGTSGTNYQYDDLATIYKFIALDGTSFIITNFRADCTTPANYSNGITGNMSQVCGRLWVDVNGPVKGPNYMGKDVFLFWITNGRGALLYPQSGADDSYGGTNYWWKFYNPPACSSNPGRTQGNYCTGRIMEEGWQINYY